MVSQRFITYLYIIIRLPDIGGLLFSTFWKNIGNGINYIASTTNYRYNNHQCIQRHSSFVLCIQQRFRVSPPLHNHCWVRFRVYRLFLRRRTCKKTWHVLFNVIIHVLTICVNKQQVFLYHITKYYTILWHT